MYRFIFNRIKKIIPKISETELIALNSGNTSLDRSIFSGKVTMPSIAKTKDLFDTSKVDTLLDKYGEETVYPNDKSKEMFDYIGKNNFLSLIIDE